MATTNLGRVSIVPRGEYDPAASYERLDLVQYEGASYLALQAVKGVKPSDGKNYMLIGGKGASAYEQAVAGGLSATQAQFNSALARIVREFGAWDEGLTDGEKRDPEVVYEKSRPIDWMKLPGLEEVGEGELWLLFQWPKGSTHRCQFSVNSAAGGSVEVGRYAGGVFTPNEGYTQEYGAKATVALTLDSADFGDVTSRGDVQAMVRFSGDLTSFTANTDKTGCVDGVVNAPNMTTLSFAKSDDLAYFAFAGISPQATSISFRYSYFLRAIRGTARGLNAVANGSICLGTAIRSRLCPRT